MKISYKILQTIWASFICVIVIASVITVSVKAIGVSPAEIAEDYVMPGNTIRKTFTITNASESKAIDVKVEPDLGEMSTWVSFEPGNTFTIPANTNKFSFSVILNVPQTAELKNFQGFIRLQFAEVDPEAQQSSVSLVQGIRLDVNLTTTMESYTELIVRKISIEEVKEGGSAQLSMVVENKGNTIAKPSKVEVDITDLNKNVLKTLVFDSVQLNGIEPGTEGTIKVALDTASLLKGEYFANIRIYVQDSILREETVVFEVKSVLIPGGETGDVGVNTPVEGGTSAQSMQIILIASIVGIAVVALLVILLASKRLNDKEHKNPARGTTAM